jgi:hypothetical protein
MTAPMIVAGTTGETRIYCQFWGEWKTPARDIRIVDFAQMDDSDLGLRINVDCPREWLDIIWAAYLEVVSGIVPTPTHTISFAFNANNPTLTAIAPPSATAEQLAFDMEGITS